ncbi:hypothetical protein HGT71_04285 [Rosenbergiella epipactidis]|uniref:hypothetical protein n=2 Tax=Rosenbergiella epipactidis TaxID=1544694 RepID=UPI001FD33268|nr:hypothetical protein [Rosenbergiella epipactidis]MBT0717497.1 hypothetical protein [Rosenbergiella epipactidis]
MNKSFFKIGILISLSSLSSFSYSANVLHNVDSLDPHPTQSNGKSQPPIKYSMVWADKSGATHIQSCRIEGLQFKTYAPPSAPQWIGVAPDQIESIAYAVLPPGYVGTWHHAPGPQWVVTLSGKWSVETTDGAVLVQGPGEMQFNADSSSHPRKNDTHVGHISRTIGNEPNVQLIIKLKPNVKITNGCTTWEKKMD